MKPVPPANKLSQFKVNKTQNYRSLPVTRTGAAGRIFFLLVVDAVLAVESSESYPSNISPFFIC